MSALVLLNLLTSWGKEIKCETAKHFIAFRKKLYFNYTGT